ncbi:cytochrome P450 [Aquabacterium sp. OR-4]|uniref:cytochrome P450 n=1 Tax=Aquabacterium sp. OR-4 TaxID=2978127 RepID=UPI0021B3FB3D|nr:cytochrome P450 [Aquabacterium sp. OR-4]MDT7833649.1 cytochrome P450 [Aquabacterium sp. OR-4]
MLDLDAPGTLTPFQFNQRLLQVLSCDEARAGLYAQLLREPRLLQFQSMAQAAPDPAAPGAVPAFHQTVTLLTAREHIDQAMRDDRHFSNAPYAALGSGTFMLGLDGMAHAMQRGFAQRLLKYQPAELAALIDIAWRAAAVLPLKQRRFDAAALAEQVGLRFAALLFGFPLHEHPYLEAAMRYGYQHLVYQIIGRHFSYDPAVPVAAQRSGALFLQRCVAVLGDYARGEVPDDVRELQHNLAAIGQARGIEALKNFQPVCARLVAEPSELSGTEQASLVGGLIAGTIGNLQACVSIALQALMSAPQGALTEAIAEAHAAQPGTPQRSRLQRRIVDALADNPPAAFLPRQVISDLPLSQAGQPLGTLKAGSLVLLAIGAGTREARPRAAEFGDRGDPLIFGAAASGDAGAQHVHDCIGAYLALPLVLETVRRVLMLPGITRSLDTDSGEPAALQKTWGFRCDKLMLEYSRDRAITQQPLAVIMKIKAPVAENAEKLKATIAVAAPRIEMKLDEARHVHFAWFMLLDNDTRLGLFTAFDGAFDEYLKHFSRTVGPLFDSIYQYLEDAPPLPVADHPEAFVAKARQYNTAPVGGYFYSAYPAAPVVDIHHALKERAR